MKNSRSRVVFALINGRKNRENSCNYLFSIFFFVDVADDADATFAALKLVFISFSAWITSFDKQSDAFVHC